MYSQVADALAPVLLRRGDRSPGRATTRRVIGGQRARRSAGPERHVAELAGAFDLQRDRSPRLQVLDELREIRDGSNRLPVDPPNHVAGLQVSLLRVRC